MLDRDSPRKQGGNKGVLARSTSHASRASSVTSSSSITSSIAVGDTRTTFH